MRNLTRFFCYTLPNPATTSLTPKRHFIVKAILALENGTVFEGRAVGAKGEATGELVFNTSMTGYQEILTDPSYAGQIVTMCEHDPRFGYVFMRRAALALAKRLSATRMQLLDVFGGQMPSVAEDT